MAIQTGIIIFKKKIGNVVGRKNRNSEYVLSKYQPTVRDANTETQQQTRTRFTMLVKLGSKIQNFINIGLKAARRDAETVLNAFTRMNFEDGTTGTWPNYDYNYSKIVVAKGNVDNPYNTAAQVQGTDLSFSWTDNSGIGNALETDKAMFLVYNTDKKVSIYDNEASDRSTRQASVSLPSSWTGDTIEVYFAMRRVDSPETSDSLYMGNFQL